MIHETAIITGDVTIEPTAIVEPYAVITGPARIGAEAYIGAHAVIGAPAQHAGSYPSPITGHYQPKGVEIGRGACVREYVTVHQGVVDATIVGKQSLVMAYSHVSHDSVVGACTTLATGTTLGGFTYIGSHVTFGQSVVTHPWVVIGGGSMIGLNSSVLRDVNVFDKVAGCPAKSIGTNRDRFSNFELILKLEQELQILLQRRVEVQAEWAALARIQHDSVHLGKAA